jgi:hypothetical protein
MGSITYANTYVYAYDTYVDTPPAKDTCGSTGQKFAGRWARFRV